MALSLVQWHAVIGIFNCHSSVMPKSCSGNLTSKFISAFENLLPFYQYQESAYIILKTLLYIFVLLQCHGDIKLNPGPKKLNLNSLSVYQNLHS